MNVPVPAVVRLKPVPLIPPLTVSALAELFVDDVRIGRELRGRDALRANMAAQLADNHRTILQVTNHVIDVIDADVPWVLDRDDLKSLCKNTPFDEARFSGRVMRTIVGGRTVYEHV